MSCLRFLSVSIFFFVDGLFFYRCTRTPEYVYLVVEVLGLFSSDCYLTVGSADKIKKDETQPLIECPRCRNSTSYTYLYEVMCYIYH